jgi:hypothetical protein
MKTTCLYCEKEYETKRESSCYCSNSCRTGAYKVRKKNEHLEAEKQKAAKAQQEIADQQKLIDAELRKQKAEQRKKAKEEKVLKSSMEIEKTDNENSQLEAETPATEHTHEYFPPKPEKPEMKLEPQKYNRALAVRRRLEAARRPKIDVWDVINKVVKAYNLYNKY